MSDKQIRHFGTKAQRAGLKRRKAAARSKPKSKVNPSKTRTRTKIVYRTVKAKKTKRRSNPLQMVTLGLINPRKGKKNSMTKTKKRKSTKKSTSTRRRAKKNGTRIVVMGRRPNKRRSNKHHSHRNPSIAGVSGAKGVGELLLGGVGGVILASATPAFLPAVMTANPIFSAIGVGVIGWVAGMAVGKMGSKNIGDGVMFGAWLSAAKDLITNFVPGIPGLTGMGMFVPAAFNEPDNPVWAGNQRLIASRAAAAAAAAPAPSLKGVASAYGGAY